jgi:exodeoxyribonuclease VII small subunit
MPPKKSDKMTFSASFAELEKIVEKFEREDVDLEEGLKDFEQALEIARALKDRLTSVENKVVEIKKKFGDVLREGALEEETAGQPSLGV